MELFLYRPQCRAISRTFLDKDGLCIALPTSQWELGHRNQVPDRWRHSSATLKVRLGDPPPPPPPPAIGVIRITRITSAGRGTLAQPLEDRNQQSQISPRTPAIAAGLNVMCGNSGGGGGGGGGGRGGGGGGVGGGGGGGGGGGVGGGCRGASGGISARGLSN